MKKFLNFLAWTWRKTDWFDRSMMVACFLIGAALPADAPMRSYLLYAGFSVPALWALRFVFYVGPRSAWRQYNKEQEETVELLKKDYSSERKF